MRTIHLNVHKIVETDEQAYVIFSKSDDYKTTIKNLKELFDYFDS